MISHNEFLNAGFEYAGTINNRFFYNKLGFNVMEHNGTAYINGNYDKQLSTIVEVNQAFLDWTISRIKELITTIFKAYNELEMLEQLHDHKL